ncbi:MAG TPA: hypothetical protein VGX68_03415 [Thermoanaerobaculia bacterium]|jgi:hypothetical protein|nr:hypothetical protein [Thermoanaerobaculia bacterium]
MSASRVPPAAVYELAVAVDRLPEDLRLRSLEWGVLFAVTGRHTVAQIGGHLSLAPEERDDVFARLLELGLLAERPLSAGEYLRAAATVDGEPRTLAGFLRAGLAGPDGEAVIESHGDAAPAAPAPMSDLELGGFEPLALPDEEIAMELTDLPVPAPPPLSLRAVMRFIIDQSGDADAGQLDIYRAFVRVNPQLLRRNGITTLRFEEDRLLTDPDLQQALLASVEQVVGRSCPPEVFVRG